MEKPKSVEAGCRPTGNVGPEKKGVGALEVLGARHLDPWSLEVEVVALERCVQSSRACGETAHSCDCQNSQSILVLMQLNPAGQKEGPCGDRCAIR